MALEGSLDEFSLAEIIGLVERARRTGALEVHGTHGDGTLYLRDGLLCAGEADDVTGPVAGPGPLRARLVDVCFALLRAGGGTFRFVSGREPPWPADRPLDTDPVLAVAQRLADAWERIAMLVPSVDDRPALNDDLQREPLTLDRLAFRVLRAIDGSRTVRQIARELELAAVEAGAVTADLVAAGAARIATPAGAPPTRIPPVTRPAVLGDRDREREREELALRAGLRTGPVPTGGAPDLSVTAAAAAAVEAPPAGMDVPPAGVEAPEGGADLAGDAGAVPPVPGGEPGAGPGDDPAGEGEPTTYVTRDRGALLRLFSALRDGDG